jgi:hypothetical protein
MPPTMIERIVSIGVSSPVKEERVNCTHFHGSAPLDY